MKRTLCMLLCLVSIVYIHAENNNDTEGVIQYSPILETSEPNTDKHIQYNEDQEVLSQGHFITFNLPAGFNPLENQFQIATLEDQFYFIVPTQDAKIIIVGKTHGTILTIYIMALEEDIQDDETIVEVAVEIDHQDFELQKPIDCLQLTGKFYQETNELIIFVPFYDEEETAYTEQN